MLVLHLGTPAGPVDPPALTGAAAQRGLRTVICGRPGRSVADVAADVTAVLDHLGADRFVTLGWSGGGPHALACVALLPDRCAAAATLAGVAPFDAGAPGCQPQFAVEGHDEGEGLGEFTAVVPSKPPREGGSRIDRHGVHPRHSWRSSGGPT
ncbi:alpha/beta fold hydrolase [Dactylosporangium sp. NPDC005572]|uniref:alpha/beta fold hydrolase n=1 Tax=Dactylosporangium sp. NPDC005572 TaxID=3156889 RepID=UPI0033A6DC61